MKLSIFDDQSPFSLPLSLIDQNSLYKIFKLDNQTLYYYENSSDTSKDKCLAKLQLKSEFNLFIDQEKIMINENSENFEYSSKFIQT